MKMRVVGGWLVAVSTLGCSGPADVVTASGSSPRLNSAGSVASAPVAAASAGDRCAAIARDIAQHEADLLRAGTHRSCVLDKDCECFGPPECNGALGAGCPFPLAVTAAEQLRPFVRQWEQANCGPPIWSPYRCQPACREGQCVSLAD